MTNPRPLIRLAAAFAAAAGTLQADTFTATEMMRLERLADPRISPDGSQVVRPDRGRGAGGHLLPGRGGSVRGVWA